MAEESRASQIERAIREVAGLDVMVEEADGTITLEGLVDSERDRQAAEDIAADLAGDTDIDNALEIEDLLPVSVEAFASEQRSAEVSDRVPEAGEAEVELNPDFSGPFFGFNRPDAKVSQGLIQSWWSPGMMSGHKNAYDCIIAFSETDFTADLKKFDVPTLIVHGDDDQIVPIGASAMLSSKLVKGSTLKIYPGGSHSLGDTSKDQLNADLLAFIRG